MSQNKKWAAWQNLLHTPVEVVKEEPVKVAPKVTKIAEALQPVEPIKIEPEVTQTVELEPEPINVEEVEPVLEVKPEIKKIKKTKTEE